jgi:hypothetical protein
LGWTVEFKQDKVQVVRVDFRELESQLSKELIDMLHPSLNDFSVARLFWVIPVSPI